MAIEEHTYEAIDKIFDSTGEYKTVAKGMNMLDRGQQIARKWDKFDNPVAVVIDAARMDQHVSKPLLQFEHKTYKQWLDLGRSGDLEPFDWLAKFQLKNEGRYYGKDGKVKYVVDGCRMSGDMNTSCGNINIMCALLWTYLRSKQLLGKVEVLNDGDDSTIIMERSNVDKFTEGMSDWFTSMGFTMKFEGIYHVLEEIIFCQAKPVKLEQGWTLVPRPSKRLYSDLVTTKPIHSKKVYDKWLGSVAGCGIAASSGVPVFNSFYRWLARGATPYIPQQGDVYYRYRMELVKGMQMKSREPSWDERISFYFAFGITPQAQLLLEKFYDDKPDPVWSPSEQGHTLPVLESMQWLCPPEQGDRNSDIVN